MSTESEIRGGMTVFDSNGEKIGSISEVYTPTETTPITGETMPGGGPAEFAAPGDVVVEEVDVVVTDVPDDVVGYGPSAVAEPPTESTTTYGGGPTGAPDYGIGETAAGDAAPGGATDHASDVVSPAFEPATGQAAEAGAGSTPNATGTATMTETGYFVVDYGGFLGLGQKELSSPFDAVAAVDTGDSVTLNATKEESENRFQACPPFMTDARARTEIATRDAAIPDPSHQIGYRGEIRLGPHTEAEPHVPPLELRVSQPRP